MTSKPNNTRVISRRSFVRRGSAIAGALLGPTIAGGVETEPAALASKNAQPLPKRVLGRTGVSISTFTLGTAPCGSSPKTSPEQVAKIVNTAIDHGCTSIDTARAYGNAEEGIGRGLGRRRHQVFLATKVLPRDVEEAKKSLAESLRLLKTDYVDLLYYHHVGGADLRKAFDDDGLFTWLVRQKQRGTCRFIGVSGHNVPLEFDAFLKTGEVDAMLLAMNFADHYTYNFEEKVVPLCRQYNVGVVAMKVFGGAHRKKGYYQDPEAPPQIDVKHLNSAIRYALGIPGVVTVNIGAHKPEQVVANIEMVRDYKPLSEDEALHLASAGRRLAAEWGTHFGPLAYGDVAKATAMRAFNPAANVQQFKAGKVPDGWSGATTDPFASP